jgi:hypothetical protein
MTVQAHIEQVRQLWALRDEHDPSEVRHGHVPVEYRRHLRRRGIVARDGFTSICVAATGCSHQLPHWWDHAGSITTADGERLLVIEPYDPSAATMAEIRSFAERAGLRVAVDDNSWWFPGRTVRITFEIPDDQEPE